MSPSQPTGDPARSMRFLPYLFLALAAVVVYANSLAVPFIFDDTNHILANPRVQLPGAMWRALLHTNRPLVDLSLAINYALGQDDPAGYHIWNLCVHIANAFLLYTVLWWTFLSDRAPGWVREQSRGLALAAALLWTVHPLLTQGVTYIVQRAESMMGFFFLLTLWALVQTHRHPPSRVWPLVTVLAAAAGMGCKEVMVTAPVVVLAYDRIFLGRSFRRIWDQRRWLYGGLVLCWVLLAVLATTPRANSAVAGVGIPGLTPVNYGLTQLAVITHYLRLVFWPHPLVFDYFSWPLARGIAPVWPQAVLISSLVGLTIWGLRRRPFFAFWGLWFFVILGPTSSVFPIGDLAFEQRMYLPSVAVVVLAVLAVQRGIVGLVASPAVRRAVSGGLLIVGAILLGGLTILRNVDYQDEAVLWRGVLFRWPENDRAHMTLGNVALRQGRWEQARRHYEQAIALNPSYDKPYCALATLNLQLGEYDLARENVRAALRISPGYAPARLLLGLIDLEDGRRDAARQEFERALAADPALAAAHYRLAMLDFEAGRLAEAAEHFQSAVRLDPRDVKAHYNLGTTLANLGRLDEALRQFSAAVDLDPDFQDAAGRKALLEQLLTGSSRANAPLVPPQTR